MSPRTRHWKQHWDPNADLIFRKRLRFGSDPKKPFILPGEPVTDEHRAKLGPARVRRWFENGTLEIANFRAPEPQRELVLREQAPERLHADRLTQKLEDVGVVTHDDL
jgi:hypothetical protein